MSGGTWPPVNYGQTLSGQTRDALTLTFEVRTENGNELVESGHTWPRAVHVAIRLAYDRREPMIAVDAVTGHLLRVEHVFPVDELDTTDREIEIGRTLRAADELDPRPAHDVVRRVHASDPVDTRGL